MNLGDKILQLRKKNGLSQEQYANKTKFKMVEEQKRSFNF